MRRIWLVLIAVALTLIATASWAGQRVHVVGPGHTLGKIAKRYHVSIEDLCKANHISRRDPIKPGQKLVIPDKDHPAGAAPPPPKHEAKADDKGHEPKGKDEPTSNRVGNDGMRELDVPGGGPAYYYEPIGAGRLGLRPVLMYLHGRGGHPQRDCRRWATVARRLGWLVCPSGPGARGDGRGWNNNWYVGQRVAVATVQALRKKYGRRVQLYGNTIIGFSEGAYVAMNVGVREPRTFNRWLILAGKTTYWGGPGLDELGKHHRTLRRVYLITGEQDGVIDGTRQLREWLKKSRVPTRISTPTDMGHELALERKPAMYRAALIWLDRGVTGRKRSKKKSVAKRNKSAKRKR